jgi:pimeloyl-ACP methyl ester carboxylesterase
MEDAQEIWKQITCPVLLFRGLDSWAVDPEEDGRIHAIRNYQLVNVPGAGHWVHHDQPGVFIKDTLRFLLDD